jgi:hypothetical protein
MTTVLGRQLIKVAEESCNKVASLMNLIEISRIPHDLPFVQLKDADISKIQFISPIVEKNSINCQDFSSCRTTGLALRKLWG